MKHLLWTKKIIELDFVEFFMVLLFSLKLLNIKSILGEKEGGKEVKMYYTKNA